MTDQAILLRDAAPSAAIDHGDDASLPHAATAWRVECIGDAETLATHMEAWELLAAEALVPAPSNEPAWLLAALRHLAGTGAPVSVALAWRDGAAGPRLMGVFAFEAHTVVPFAGIRVARDWGHLFAYLGTPLLHRDHAAEALAACLDALDEAGARVSILRLVPDDGPMKDAVAAALAMGGRSHVVLDAHERAAFRVAGSVEAYLQENLTRKRRKEFKRLRSRLGEEGHVSVDRLERGGNVEAWCRDFYALERSGWKGQQGTAIACERHWRDFFDDALAKLGEDGDLLFWRLNLDGRPIAMIFGLARGREAWLCKIAYDEQLARFSPGALIIFDVMEGLVADGRVEVADSCAVPDHPMINHIWRDTIALRDVVVSARNSPEWQFRALVGLERARRSLRSRVKRHYHALKRLAKGNGK